MSNPVLNEKFLENERVLQGEPMSVNGSISKSFILFGVLVAAAAYTWFLMSSGYTDMAGMLAMGGAIVGFILALIIIFTKKAMHVLTPLYAVCEGFFVGGISAMFEAAYSGIVFQAVAATFAAVFSMLALYRAGLIKATEKFRSVILISTMSIAVIYLIQIIASFFGRGIPQIFTSSNLGILFSLFVVAIAALNLILDFDFIERGSEAMLEKQYEWYGAFGLMVTVVWLYIELLKLLAKLNDRR